MLKLSHIVRPPIAKHKIYHGWDNSGHLYFIKKDNTGLYVARTRAGVVMFTASTLTNLNQILANSAKIKLML